MKEFNLEVISELQQNLNHHGVYKLVNGQEALQIFMQHHVFSVWDFMSLVKYLQNHLAPARSPWGIHASRESRRFINSIVLEEESDTGLPDENGNPTYASHFEMYCDAMEEVNADTTIVKKFATAVMKHGFEPGIESLAVPDASRVFMQKTMGFIGTDKPHVVAAAFALGREKIIPDMFRQLLSAMNLSDKEAPAFHYYLERHIHLDEDFHAPLSLHMLNELCDGDAKKLNESEKAAQDAIKARIEFWDGVANVLQSNSTS